MLRRLVDKTRDRQELRHAIPVQAAAPKAARVSRRPGRQTTRDNNETKKGAMTNFRIYVAPDRLETLLAVYQLYVVTNILL